MSKLKLDTRHGYEGCVCDEAGPIVANVTTDQNTDLAEEIVATVNWCRANGVDTSNPEWLREYREQIAERVCSSLKASGCYDLEEMAAIQAMIIEGPKEES